MNEYIVWYAYLVSILLSLNDSQADIWNLRLYSMYPYTLDYSLVESELPVNFCPK